MAAATKPKHEPGKTFTAGSKAHGGRKWVYKTNSAGKAIPVRPHSSNKVDKAAKTKPAAKPAVDTRPYGALTPTLNREADAEFAGEEAVARQGQGVATQHQSDLQTVYDRFKAQLAGQDEATRAQQNAQLGQMATQQANTIAGLGQAVGQQAGQVSAGAKATGGVDYGADVAKIGAAGAAGAQAVAQPAVTAAGQQAGIQSNLVAQLGQLMDVERGRQAGQASQQVQTWQTKRQDIAGRKGKSKADAYKERLETERKQIQQEFTNTLAQQTLAADKADSLRDYKAKMKDINAKLSIADATNATALDVAGTRAGSASTVAGINASASDRRSQRQADATVKAARIRARATENAANIRAVASGGGKGSKTASITTADGKKYEMSAADAKKWNDRRRASIDGVAALTRALGTEKSESDAIKRVKAATHIPANVVAAFLGASKGKPATAAQRKALRTFFPGGIIPPGFLTGKVND